MPPTFNEPIFASKGLVNQQFRNRLPSTLEDTRAGFFEAVGAKFDYSYYADTSTGFRRDLNDNADFNDDKVRTTLSTFKTITGDKQYDTRRARMSDIIGVEDYNKVRDILQDEDAMTQYREYRNANPDAELVDLDVVKEQLIAAEEKRYNLYQSISRREYGGILSSLVGEGAAAFTDPVVLATIPLGFLTGGGATAAATGARGLAVGLGRTVATEVALGAGSEAVIQYGSAQHNYNFYQREHDAVSNIIAAGLFAGFIPVAAKGISAPVKYVAGKVGNKLEVDPSRAIKETDVERLETLRAHAQVEFEGTVGGAVTPIHKVGDVNIRGLADDIVESAHRVGVERVSTLRSIVNNDEVLSNIVEELDVKGIELSDNLIETFRAQREPDLQKALEFQEMVNASKAPEPEAQVTSVEQMVAARNQQIESGTKADTTSQTGETITPEETILENLEGIKAAVRTIDEDLENLKPCLI